MEQARQRGAARVKSHKRRCNTCGTEVVYSLWPKEQAIRYLYRQDVMLEFLRVTRTRGHRGAWFLLGTLFKRLGFYHPSCSPMDIPVDKIVAEARHRRAIGGGCWRDEERDPSTREKSR